MSHALTAIVVLKTLTFVTGGLITFYAVRAYRRTGSPALRALAIGFGVVTLGSAIGGGIDQITRMDPIVALAVESVFLLVGFATILYSLFVT
ncbi:MAG: hypothetical protein ABEJ68_09775 [Halobacteriaceae archaeon]